MQLSTTELKKKTKQTTRTRTDSQKWRSHGGLSVGRRGENGGKGPVNKKHKWSVQNRQGEGKNSIGNVEDKEFICMTHGHELKWRNASGSGVQGGGE